MGRSEKLNGIDPEGSVKSDWEEGLHEIQLFHFLTFDYQSTPMSIHPRE